MKKTLILFTISIFLDCSSLIAQYTNGNVGVVVNPFQLPQSLPNGTSGQVLSTNGTGIGWINATSGTVSSVGLQMPSVFTVTGSPVTSSGTFTVIPQNTTGYLFDNAGTASWVSLNSTAWQLTGNSGTTLPTNFVGTTDSVSLLFKINKVPAGYLGLNGNTDWGDYINVTGGRNNTIVGYQAGKNNTSNFNCMFGYGAGVNTTSGDNNVMIGNQGGSGNTTGSGNVYISDGGSNATGSNLTIIGNGADVNADGYTNSTGLGFNTQITASNQFVFGNSDITDNKFTGDFNINGFTGTAGQVFTSQGIGVSPIWKTPSNGTVTSVSSGNLSPYFTSSVSNSTTTPSITYTATTVPIHKALIGGTTNQSTAIPTFRSIYGSDLPSTIDTNFGANLTTTEIPYAVSTSSITTSSNLAWNSNHNSLNIGNPAQQSNSGIISSGNSSTYYQYVFQNTNSTSMASTDLVLYNDLAKNTPADTAVDYFNIGYNSSTNTDPLYTAIWKNGAYLYNNIGGLWIGVASADTLGFFGNGTLRTNRYGYFPPSGALSLTVPLSASSGGTGLTSGAWGLSGNTITSSQYLGSNNNQPLVFRQNGRFAGWIGTSGLRDVVLGYNADTIRIGSGNDISVMGYESFMANKGSRNTGYGSQAGFHDTTGFDNTFTGCNAGLSCSSGDSNTYDGSQSGSNNGTANGNTAVGYYAGHQALGRENTFVGALAGEGANAYKYITALGYGATATASYQMVFGMSNNLSNQYWGDLTFNGSAGTSGQVLVSNGALSSPTWTNIGNGGLSLISGTGTSGQVAFFNGTNSETSSSHFLWDNTRNRFGVNMTPTTGAVISDSSNRPVRNLIDEQDGYNTHSAKFMTLKVRYKNGVESSILNNDTIGSFDSYGYIGGGDTLIGSANRVKAIKISGTTSASFQEQFAINTISRGMINAITIDTNGNITMDTIKGATVWNGAPLSSGFQGSSAYTYSFSSATSASMVGLATATSSVVAVFTAGNSGSAFLSITVALGNSTASDGAQIQMYYGTGTAPVAGASVTGTKAGGPSGTISTGGLVTPGVQSTTCTAYITGLTPKKAYWFDLSAICITGGTGVIQIPNATAFSTQ